MLLALKTVKRILVPAEIPIGALSVKNKNARQIMRFFWTKLDKKCNTSIS